MTVNLFDLHPTHNPHRWYLPITEDVSVGPVETPFMFGGIGLAASVTALERTCGRPVIWATAQYLSFAQPPSVMDLDVWIPVNGKQTTQARVVGHVRDQEILTVNAALGERPGLADDQWVSAPVVPPPSECRLARKRPGEVIGLQSRLEIRIAHGRFRTEPVDSGRSADGRLTLWMRVSGGEPVDRGMLAVMADYLPSAVINAAGDASIVANSLDNTIRFAGLHPTEWVLCDIHVESLHRGFAHGQMRMFSERGQLLAIGSQSMILRRSR